MLDQIKNIYNSKYTRQFTDIRNIGLYIFTVIVLAIAWSAAKTVQSNYELQKQISNLKQQNAVTQLQNENSALNNKYLQTDQYLELSARQNLGLAAPGEKVLLVPKSVAMKYVNQSLISGTIAKPGTKAKDSLRGYQKNLEEWRDFLLGRKLFKD